MGIFSPPLKPGFQNSKQHSPPVKYLRPFFSQILQQNSKVFTSSTSKPIHVTSSSDPPHPMKCNGKLSAKSRTLQNRTSDDINTNKLPQSPRPNSIESPHTIRDLSKMLARSCLRSTRAVGGAAKVSSSSVVPTGREGWGWSCEWMIVET